ncbi:MAG TPA: sulfotransferase [Solirubrobacterales bacterium]|nr:sulfotransferase [Solirubrobacterales bacterium]
MIPIQLTDHGTRTDATAEAGQHAPAGPPPIVFVGGTGRSGTHVVAKMLGRHSFYRNINNEVRFHCNPRGYPDLLAGSVSLDEFLKKLRKFWWYRVKAGEFAPAMVPKLAMGREVRGLHKLVPEERFDAAVDEFERSYEDDPIGACRKLFFDLFRPLADEEGKPGLIEMSSDTVLAGPTLLRVFPEAKLIHSVRDGRDAGSSKVEKRSKREHPTDVISGIDWWEKRLRAIDESSKQVPPDKLLTISLDDLVFGNRRQTYRSLHEFLGIDREPRVRRYFKRRMSADRAHRDRWREDLTDEGAEQVMRHYEATLDRLEADGVHCAPLLRRVYEDSL